jgi:hypothetical protein
MKPPYAPRDLIAERLALIFPEGTPNRNYCVRQLAASAVFVALYIGAVEGEDRYFGPKHVYRMTNEQSALVEEFERETYASAVARRGFVARGTRWYQDNTREPIRDETLKDGLVELGAVITKDDVATTSSRPRYALEADFAGLFDPTLVGQRLERAITAFQLKHLSKSTLARLAIVREGATSRTSGMLVRFPSGETRKLAPGPSSSITRSVVEQFAPRFLGDPAILWLSESAKRRSIRDDRIANAIGLKIDASRNLPDLILADLRPADPIIVFVEVVATDGAMTERRRSALLAYAEAAGFPVRQVAFMTAYQDRQSAGFKKTVAQLAWGSYAWFASQPENVMLLRDGSVSAAKLVDLLASL